MNILYVLVSSENDTYYEQTLISIQSLRKYMPDANVYLLVDEKTEKTLTGKRALPENYKINLISIKTPDEYNARNRSRYLKTTMYKYMDEDYLYIDGDTIICDRLDDIDTNIKLGMVLDGNQKVSKAFYKNNIYKYNGSRVNCNSVYNDMHFNSGVMWTKKCPENDNFFEMWHNTWKETLKYGGNIADQSSLNDTNYKLNGYITELDGIWNCQLFRYSACAKYIYNAKVLHYFSSNLEAPFSLSNKEIQKSILQDEHKELDAILNCPKAAFERVADLNSNLYDLEKLLTQYSFFKFFILLYKHLKPVFYTVNFIFYLILFPKRILNNKADSKK